MGYRSIAEFAIYLQIMKGETKTPHEFRVDKYGFLQPFCDSVRYLPIVGGGGGPTLFLSVDFVNILPKKGGGQTLMSTKALTKC